MLFFLLCLYLVASKLYMNIPSLSEDDLKFSTHESEYGNTELVPSHLGDEDNMGIELVDDYRKYGVVIGMEEEIENKETPLVLQYSLRESKNVECGGSYLKYVSADELEDASEFYSETKYSVMFGPDVCGANKKVHVIFNYKGENLEWKKKVTPPQDKLNHIYTLVVFPDHKYEMLIDGEVKEEGTLEEDWDFLAPLEIDDPEDLKPEDWVDEAKIPDPEDVKPEDWDNEPQFISDPDAEVPEDWDEEEDGMWEAPQIPNPEYKGVWSPRLIDNPEYKGVWKPKRIPNPEYEEDEDLHVFKIKNAGIEVWRVRGGAILSNFLIGDDVEEAKEVREELLNKMKVEKEIHEKEEEEKRAIEEEERLKREEERKRQEEEEKQKEEEEEAARILEELEGEDEVGEEL